jgi:hypothetical protein
MEKDLQAARDLQLRKALNGLQPARQPGSWEQLADRLGQGLAPERTDALLREKLSEGSAISAPLGWDQLADRLDQGLAPERTDALLREKLSEGSAISVPLGWEQLADRLDAEGSLPERESDEILRDKLTTLDAGLEPQGWAALASRMDNAESDEIFHYRLDRHAPTPLLSGWALLAAKLELIAGRRAAIYSYKFSELCLVVVALLLFWHLQPSSGTSAPAPAAIANLIDESTTVDSAQKVAKQDFEEASQVAVLSQTAGVVTTTDNEEMNRSPEAMIARPSTVAVETIASIYPDPLSMSEAKINFTTGVYGTAELLPVHPFEPLSYPRLEMGLPIQLKNPAAREPAEIYLRAFISPWDFNQIVTPRQAVNDIILDEDIRISYGSSAGVLIENAHRKHLFQFGLIYSNRSYIPTVLKEVEDVPLPTGNVEVRDTNYSRIRFQTISLPAVYQRELLRNDKWRIAASVGVSLNLNILATFRKSPTFDQDVLDWTRQSPTPEFGLRGNSNSDLPRLSAIDLVYPEQGLFQGGSLLANSGLSASLGFSIERNISERFSLYLAPRFSRAIYYRKNTGLEPFNDRIHNNSIQLGTRMFLGTKQ